jgi:hypothetical protein
MIAECIDSEVEQAFKSSRIKIVDGGKTLSYNTLKDFPALKLIDCNVIIDSKPVYFFKGVIPDGLYSPARYGIGYQYRNFGTCASKEIGKETSLELISSAWGMADCFDGDVVNI